MAKSTGVTDDRTDTMGLLRTRTDARTVAPRSERRVIELVRTRPAELVRAVNSDRNRFAAKVRAARAVLGWSQTDLARRTGLSQRSIYRLELAAVDVRRSTAVALETVFGEAGIAFEQLADGGFKIVVAGAHAVRQ